MKAKSFTRKKSNKTKNKITDLATRYLVQWTKKELQKFITEPVVIQTSDHGFLVGKFKVVGQAKYCWTVEQADNKLVHDFISKANAILYCLYEVSGRYKLAKELLDLDTKLGKLENDISQYKNTLSISKDRFKLDLALNRYSEAKSLQKSYNDILKKTLKSAKYFNFGNIHYEIDGNGR